MQTEVNETGRYERTLTVRLEEAELESAKDRAARKLSKEMKIKGFRPGKAPRSIVERMVGADHLRSEAVDEAIPGVVGEAIAESDLAPATVPRVSDLRNVDDGAIEVDVVVTLWPVLDAVPDFEGRPIEVEAPVLTDDEIEDQIEALRNQFAGLEDADREAEAGDFVMLDITVTIDGEEIVEAAANDLMYEIGSGSFIEGLDEVVTGVGGGATAEGPGSLPAGFTDHGGEDVTLTVEVKEVKQKLLPDLTDEFVADVTEFDTVEELRSRLEANMLSLKVHNARSAFENRLIEELVEELDFDLPGDLVDAEVEARVRNLGRRLEEDSIAFPDYLRITGQDEESFLTEIRSQAVQALSTRILVEAVTTIEAIEVDESDYREALESLAGSAGTDVDQLEESLAASGQKESLTGDILRRKAIDRLVAAAQPVDANGDPVDLTPIEFGDAEDDQQADDEEADTDDAPTTGAEEEN